MRRVFPYTRLRRTRSSAYLRDMVSETNLSINDLIQPLFVKEGLCGYESVASLPGVKRIGEDMIAESIGRLVDVGIKAVALFPVIDETKKDEFGTDAINEKNFISNIVQGIKSINSELIVITDVALDPYTSHGQDGLLNKWGDVDNDSTLEVLKEQALVLSKAGSDIIAPSDMMDGRVGVIRRHLEDNKYVNTLILSYAAKYSSSFYGPFRDAVGSSNTLGSANKHTYQMPISNVDEALQEVALDISEGADIVMVKPGLPYLDVISAIKSNFQIPTFAYQVSGEFAMMKAAIQKGWLSEEIIMESLICLKRAGADCIFTYAAYEVAKALDSSH
ncbi:MAG: porphobilinogen synthase [Rhodospirillaceae bacterium]|nr:porphobilinogen synthase [Rhodospirillaceae bacterium]